MLLDTPTGPKMVIVIEVLSCMHEIWLCALLAVFVAHWQTRTRRALTVDRDLAVPSTRRGTILTDDASLCVRVLVPVASKLRLGFTHA